MHRHHEHARGRLASIAIAVTLTLAACGGDDDTSAGTTTDVDVADESAAVATTAATATSGVTTTDVTTTDVTTTDVTTTASVGATAPSTSRVTVPPTTVAVSSGTYVPGGVDYRVVSLIDEPVDVYVRTTGLIEAFVAQLGVEPREVTELFAPPEGGALVITTAGAGDPECVVDCDHFIARVSALEGAGAVHTVLLYDESGEVEAYDLWEEPDAGETSANALVAPDPTSGQVVVVAVDVTDADFGMWLGMEGVEGCATSENLTENVLVGGNQTPAFAYTGDAATVLLYDSRDRECAGEPVGGPFTIEGGPGSRTLLLLTGSPGDLDGLVVPFAASASTTATADGDGLEDEAGARDTAVASMAEEIAVGVGLEAADAECFASYVVDAIGVDVALVDGTLIDLATADASTQDVAFGGLLDGIGACAIDPAVFGL